MHTTKVVLAALLFYSLFVVGQQSASAKTKVLNNLVTELVNLKSIPGQPAYQEISFTNPREGWIFISATTRLDISGQPIENDDIVKISIDDAGKEDAVLNYQFGDATTKETMRYLSAGEHKLRIWFPEQPELATLDIRNLIVRAVPAMIYCNFPCSSRGYHGVYGKEFLAKDVLPNINTIVGEGGAQYQYLQKWWKERGGQWYLEQNIPSFSKGTPDLPDPLTADAVYDYWTKSTGFTNPYLDGILADEFLWRSNQIPDFPAYIEAVTRISQNKEFKNRAIHAWTAGRNMYNQPLAKELVQAFIAAGYKWACEVYAVELSSAEEARPRLENAFPTDMIEHMIITLGNFSTPPHTLNTNPHVDFKVHLDMQFHYLANAPECAGLFGIMAYKARYANEEYLRWTGRLFRHYCIEGNTGLLSDEYGFKYVPGHITNADFNDGLKDWTVAAATPKSVRAGTMPGLSAMLGRYGTPGQGNNYLLTKRSANKPNQVSQEIKNLVSGKLYSAKLFVAAYQDYVKGESVRKTLAVSLDIDNVIMLKPKTLLLEVDGIFYASVGPFAGKTPPWMNYHRLVFRALADTATLTISDWTNTTTPGGPIGQEILYNFVEVEPYIAD
jgi:hypothetical protein